MTIKNSDFLYLLKWIASLRLQHVIIIAAIGYGLYYLSTMGDLRTSKVDRTDYKAVGDDFVRNNATIVNKVGTITKVSHIGVGGGTGKTSSNVYQLKGTIQPGIGIEKRDIGKKRTGICYVTLHKDNEGLWFVQSATLQIGGAQHTIPVSRTSEKRNIKVFD